MKELTDSIEIKTTPEKIFQWFMNIENNYLSWHPDHINWRWIKGKPWELGSTVVAKEYLHGELHTIKSKVVKIEKDRVIEYKNSLPIALISPKGSFKLIKTNSGCIFTATLSFRLRGFFSKIFPGQIEGILKHMKEEGENLKQLIE